MKTRNKILLILLCLTFLSAVTGYNTAMQIQQYNYYTWGMAGYDVLLRNFDISVGLGVLFGFLALIEGVVCLILREVERKIERIKIVCPYRGKNECWWKKEEKERKDTNVESDNARKSVP